MRIGWGSGREGLEPEVGRARGGRGRRRGDGEEGVRLGVFLAAIFVRRHRRGEAADEAARVPGEPPLPDGRGAPQHRHAVRHTLRLPRTASASATGVEQPPERRRCRRRTHGGASAGEAPQHLPAWSAFLFFVLNIFF